jgi:hypothetical protein
LPKYYAIFGPNSGSPNYSSLSAITAPTPDADYVVELHYFYYPESIVQGIITSIGPVTGGSGYSPGTYSNVPFTGGSGTNATGTFVVSSAGIVTSATVDNGGSLYIVGDVLSVDASYLGGTGTLFSVSVASINNNTGTSWLGDNYDPVLFYGAMREAVIFMKGEQDMVTYYEKMFQESLSQLNRLGTGLERGDAYRDGQAKIKVNP